MNLLHFTDSEGVEYVEDLDRAGLRVSARSTGPQTSEITFCGPPPNLGLLQDRVVVNVRGTISQIVLALMDARNHRIGRVGYVAPK